MKARERLARLLAEMNDTPGEHALFYPDATAILTALHLTDAAALALMDRGGAVVPKYLTGDARYVSWFAQYKSRGGSDEDADTLARQRLADPEQIAIDSASYNAVLAASPYKENPND